MWVCRRCEYSWGNCISVRKTHPIRYLTLKLFVSGYIAFKPISGSLFPWLPFLQAELPQHSAVVWYTEILAISMKRLYSKKEQCIYVGTCIYRQIQVQSCMKRALLVSFTTAHTVPAISGCCVILDVLPRGYSLSCCPLQVQEWTEVFSCAQKPPSRTPSAVWGCTHCDTPEVLPGGK